ncbi:MAG: MFS transporter [Sedimentisphaerales bacterium]|nr:MFS transporter [Sedimentisphaerales bacterium]
MSNDKSSLPIAQKALWGVGGFAENLANNSLLTLAYPIFAVGMGLSPFYVGLALSASRIVDAFTDPLMGNITDNTKSRWGRRRPWIFIGAILMSVIFLAIWFTPRPEEDSQFWSATYLIIMCSLFYMGFTIWVVPYSGMGLELEVDYTERTRLMIFRVAPSFIVGIFIGSLYKITLQEQIWGGDEVVGARYVCTIVAVIMLITAIIPSIFCKERFADTKQGKIKIWESIIQTFKDKPFLLLICSVFFVFVSLFFMIPLLTYISLYYVCQGDKELMGTIGVYTAFTQATFQILSMFAIGYLAKFFDKRNILIVGLLIGILGYVSSWLLFTPEMPILTVIPPVIINIGLCTCWVLNGSFSADICDYDELKTGYRREGMYSAVFGFLSKLAIALVTTVSSSVLVLLGFEGEDLSPTVQQLFTLRWFYIVIPVAAMMAAILFMWKYPLTKQRVTEIQAQLKEIRGETSLK